MGKRNVLVGLFLSMALTLVISGNAAVADDDIRAELTQAQQEIAALRAELQEMRNDSNWQYQQQLAEAMGPAPAAAQDAGGTLILPAGWTVRPYGYIKADVIWDDSAHVGGDMCPMALPESTISRSDDQIGFTAAQTRLGAIITAPNICDLRVRGVVETDFWGGDLRVRKAYLDITGADWMFRAGQDWEILSPLFPDTLNFAYGAMCGNPGFRYPGFRFDKWWTLADDSVIIGQVAWLRETGSDVDGFLVDDGVDSGIGTFEARVGYRAGEMEIGMSGHLGEEEVDLAYPGDDDNVHTWSLNVDFHAPIWEDLGIATELFWGENYDSHAGTANGIAVVGTGVEEIEVFGGWIELGWKPAPAAGVMAFAGGVGFVDPRDADLNAGMMNENQYYYGNVKYYLSSYLWTGLEVSYHNTDYINQDDGDDFRIQHSWVLTF
ncbi:MAG: hypothetical protein JW936_04895 [Sedimentisphaerales bacterium]|nr:hypothetical protein [Sedimentisphaerales bacterium]